MTTPSFWYAPPGLLSTCLAPLGWMYASVTAHRLKRPAQRLSVPVICVGNLTAGGGGKTPLARFVYGRAKALTPDATPHFLSRGYGGTLPGPVQVNTERHTADQVGDEPLLLAENGPCWVAKDRHAGAQAAIDAGASLIIQDDGMQSPVPPKDRTLLTVKGHRGFGNGQAIPAGPLRESMAKGIARADALISVGEPEHSSLLGLQLMVGQYQADPDAIARLQEGRWVSLAGIADPASFANLLTSQGVDIVDRIELADHAPLSDADMTAYAKRASEQNAKLVVTEKDWVRLSPEWRAQVKHLPISLVFDDEACLDHLLKPLLSPAMEAQHGT
ncbi:MAG: tetraacyldisaccharide 4'-kinase [Alphaproteobacteria bacterium]|nr:tetraacyldisaccharide 4'-kinase [Alphaproteobacteria bacterium SS10]